MIALISGQLVYRAPAYVVVDVQGVGYRVFVPLTTFYELPDAGQSVTLHIHTHVKQDGINLFGFHNPEERDIFQMMLAVNGIGPKLALNILSGITAHELVKAVSQGNVSRLITTPGVGRKMAERIVLELQDKVARLVLPEAMAPAGVKNLRRDELMDDAMSALVNLGYKNQAAQEALDKVITGSSGGLTLDYLLKHALKVLAG